MGELDGAAPWLATARRLRESEREARGFDANAVVDRAIALNEPLEAFLGQQKDEAADIASTFAMLAEILGGGKGERL